MRDSASSGWVFPGRLHVFDADTGMVHTINTRQGDSEVLYVDKGVVYYRSSKRIYRTELSEEGVTNTRVIADTELVRDAHWAFLSK